MLGTRSKLVCEKKRRNMFIDKIDLLKAWLSDEILFSSIEPMPDVENFILVNSAICKIKSLIP